MNIPLPPALGLFPQAPEHMVPLGVFQESPSARPACLPWPAEVLCPGFPGTCAIPILAQALLEWAVTAASPTGPHTSSGRDQAQGPAQGLACEKSAPSV